MALPGFWRNLADFSSPRWIWEQTAYVPIVIFGYSDGVFVFFWGGDSGGEDRRREERSQHFSQPVTTKTTKSKLVTLFAAALFLPLLRYSFLPSFLFIDSPPLCILPLSTADWDQMWPARLRRGGNVEYAIRCEEAGMMLHFLSSPEGLTLFCFLTLRVQTMGLIIFLFADESCVVCQIHTCVLTHKHASVLYVVQDVHCLTLTSHFLWQDKRHAGREETVSDRLNNTHIYTHSPRDQCKEREEKTHTLLV